jgi:uncharacterized protein (TIGR02996 family)
MNDLTALHSAICANPDEDTPRLAYADFLEELGGKENLFRAEYIRGAVRIAREDKFSHAWHAARKAWAGADAAVRKQAAEHKLPWVAHLKGRAKAYDFDRGFVGHITVFSKRFVAEGAKFFADDPIRSVKFVTLTARTGTVPAAELFACPHLSRVIKLNLDGSGLGDNDLALMRDSKHLSGLRGISLTEHQRFSPKSLVSLLTDLTTVHELYLPRCYWLTSRFAETLTDSQILGRLTVLDLATHLLPPKSMIEILTTKHGGKLRELHLSVGEEFELTTMTSQYRVKDGKEIAAALSKARFPELRSLNIHGMRIGDAGLAVIAKGEGFPSLRRLDISNNHITQEGLKVLADSPVGKQLVFLCLGFNDKLELDKNMKKLAAMFPNAHVADLPQ